MTLFRSLVLVLVANLALIDAHPNNKIRRAPIVFAHVSAIDTANASLQPSMTVVIVGDQISDVGRTGEVKVPSTALLPSWSNRPNISSGVLAWLTAVS